jgi:hypothetical protein
MDSRPRRIFTRNEGVPGSSPGVGSPNFQSFPRPIRAKLGNAEHRSDTLGEGVETAVSGHLQHVLSE